MNGRKNRDSEYPKLEAERLRESIRLSGTCAGKIRHCHDCACGRPRALIRHGRRWHRMSGCRRCLASATAAVTPLSLKGCSHE